MSGKLHDKGKLYIILTIIVGVFALVITGNATFSEIDWVLTAIIAYVVANGVNVLNRRTSSPLLVPDVGPDEIITIRGPVRQANTQGGSDDAT